MQIWIGTSGFQYKEWKGTFYPQDLALAKMLGYYATRLSSTEINYTFRHLPGAASINRWREETPEAFRFSFKAPQRVTHFSKLRDCDDLMQAFARSLVPMGVKTGVVLFQLPPSFEADAALLQEFLSTLPPGLRVAFEFRHASWFNEAIYAVLRDAQAALCVAEDEKLATPPVVTAPFGYLRLRREDYQDADLDRWASWISAQTAHWTEAFVYLKHEEAGVGPKFAAHMKTLLGVA